MKQDRAGPSVGENRPEARRGRLRDAASSLQFKATALVVALTVALTSAVTWYFVEINARLMRAQYDEEIRYFARNLAHDAARSLGIDTPETLEELARNSANGRPLLYVVIQDPDRREITSAYYGDERAKSALKLTGVQSAGTLGSPTLHHGDRAAPAFLDMTYPIERISTADGSDSKSARLLGYVRAGLLVDPWYRSMSNAIDLVIGVGVVVLVVAVPIGFLLVRRIVSPLDDIVRAMQRFSLGELDIRSPICRRDEIGRLAEAFNKMADEHQKAHENLTRFNTELEERVARRTLQLRELASRDSLTGLYNRRHFNELLQNRLAEALRYNSDLACIMIDLDNFKTVNDVFGHQIGDELLIIAASAVKHELRSSDVAARFGGDEFIVLLPQTDAEQAHILGGRIAERFRHECAARCPKVLTGMSLGAASLRSLRLLDSGALIRAADDALYRAKAAGKNRIVSAAATAQAVR